MNIKVACIVLLATGVPAKEDRSEDDSKKVLQNLQGEWQMVRADFGKEAPPPDAKIGQTRLVIEGNKLIIRMAAAGPKEETATFTTDLTKKPYAIDIQPQVPGGGPKNTSVKGIFQVSAETLQLSLGRPGGERPADFTGGDVTRSTLVFQRVRSK